MQKLPTALPDVWILEPAVFADPRGFFLESYHEQKFRDLGINARFVQDNHSGSSQHTLRGLHYQHPYAQAKLCRVVQGEVLDVAVDIRRGSPTFGKWTAVRLSAENHRQMYVPCGFAHGFVVLSDTAEFLYKCDEFYHRETDRGIAWDDPDLGIGWELTGTPLLSARDRNHPRLRDVDPELLPAYSG